MATVTVSVVDDIRCCLRNASYSRSACCFLSCFILILNHCRDSLVFGSEALRIPCGAWAPRGHGRDFSCFSARNCCQFQPEERGCFCPPWGQAKEHLCEGGQLQFPSSRTISPSESTRPQGCCGPLLQKSQGGGLCGILQGKHPGRQVSR